MQTVESWAIALRLLSLLPKIGRVSKSPNSFVCIVDNAYLQKTLRGQLGRNIAGYQRSISVAMSALWAKMFTSWPETKGTVSF
ncbi:hypothetical protein [Nostoc sp. TCL26-01]|uniref:hypothetical protein n=1 Tax=Nostoc sp. TCL26-01 TaxID=2576904 RepID=UPI0015BBE2BD|nr:hypothetical protein [Nostoc sp. TCL26-01]